MTGKKFDVTFLKGIIIKRISEVEEYFLYFVVYFTMLFQ
jgi:hypothetical protein